MCVVHRCAKDEGVGLDGERVEFVEDVYKRQTKKSANDGDEARETSEEASAETSEIGSKTASRTASRTAATHAATYADDMANAPLNMVLPVAGMAAGVIGLAGIGFWLFRRRV